LKVRPLAADKNGVNPLSQTAPRLTWLAGAFVVSFCALLASIGADAHWLAALGGEIAQLGSIPVGVPYAAAPSAGWENAPVLGELVFHGLESALGDRGLVLALVGAVLLAVAVLALDMRRADAADAPSALVLMLVGVAAAQSLLVVRGQLFSLALFPVCVYLLRSQARLPSGAIWLLPPLFVLWTNLHGGVLVGVAVTGSYLLFHRLRRTPWTAIAVLVASLGAVLATPSLLDTHRYYRGVLGSEAAVGHEGLWAPLSLDMPLDVAFLAAGLPIVAAALASRPRSWELVAIAGLGAMTVQAGRNAVWLVLFAAVPAARWLTGSREWRLRPPRVMTAALAAMLALLLAVGLSRALDPPGAGKVLRARAALEAGSAPILADDINAEALALDGRLVWIANPLDAFLLGDQRLYLDWIAGRPSGDALPAAFPSVLITADTPPAHRLARREGWRVAARDERAVLFVQSR
jgi:hypothetical protein